MLKKLIHNELEIEVVYDNDKKNIELIWRGKSIDLKPDIFLIPFFEEAILELKGNKYSLSINFFNLVYMNSSTINSLIFLVKKLSEEKIRSKIIYNRDLKWQSLNFSTFNVFVTEDGLFLLEDRHLEWKLS